MKPSFRPWLGIAALAIAPLTAGAQAGATHFNIAAGPTAVVGTFGDRTDVGYHLLVGVGMAPIGSPLSFRVEGMYNEFNEKFSSNTARVSGLTGSAVYEVSHAAQGMSLYGIGGFGYYHTAETIDVFGSGGSGTVDATDNNVGYNIGGGVRFPIGTFSAYFEARYHAVTNTDVHIVPITFGLLF